MKQDLYKDMLMKPRAVALLIGILIGICSAPALGDDAQSSSIQPVALSICSGGQLFILDRRLGVVRVPSITDMTKYDFIFGFTHAWQPVDATCMPVGAGVQVFVVLSQGTYGEIMAYSGDGKWEQSIPQKDFLAGIAVDSPRSRVFVTLPRTDNIDFYVWGGHSAGDLQQLTRIPQAEGLGPGAVDSDKQILYVADIRLGEVFSVNLLTKKTQIMATGVGQPTAITFDSSSKILYIADSSGPKIFELDTSKDAPKVRVFSTDSALRQPQAIATDSAGAVFVGDQAAKAVFQFDHSGHVIGTYRFVVTIPNTN